MDFLRLIARTIRENPLLGLDVAVGALVGISAWRNATIVADHDEQVVTDQDAALARRLEQIFLAKDETELASLVTDWNEQLDEEGNTLFMFACRDGNTLVVESALKRNVPLNFVNKSGWGPIHYACLGKQDAIVKRLLEFEKIDLGRTHSTILTSTNLNNGWTPFLVAASKNSLDLMTYLLDQGANIDDEATAGHSALMIAACNGQTDMAKMLLNRGANVHLKTSGKREGALYYASRNGYLEIVDQLLQHGADIREAVANGATALHSTIIGRNLDIAELLISRGADVNREQLDGTTPLHIASVTANQAMVDLLLKHGANVDAPNAYGKTPLHDAAFHGHVEMAGKFIEKGAKLDFCDNDGMTPLHTAAGAKSKEGDHLSVVKLLLSRGAQVDILDSGNCTPSHIAACAGERGLEILREFINAGADLTLESIQGWTPLHCAHSQYGCPAAVTLMEERLNAVHPGYLKSFDPKKEKVTTREFRRVTRLSPEEQHAVLNGNVNLAGISNRIKEGRSKNIIVLTGAGISVNAGIPDFRSPKTGLYTGDALGKYNLPNPSAAFDAAYLRHDPIPFFRVCRDIFLPVYQGKHKPTLTHHFIKMLADKNLLLRNYTQNIDTLEISVGIPENLVVPSHGDFSKSYCMDCHKEHPIKEFWEVIVQAGIPTCRHCGGVVRPDVVLFGEQLPPSFLDARHDDFAKCDLLIVMGTSLVVYPFASLVKAPAENVPRLLINRDPVGVFTRCNDQDNFRDVALLGDCDDGIRTLAKELGWEDELMQRFQNF
eukprot:TRINITY_DN4347_c0_g1_i2.p1 TRINITY_DN4347_c0_g1~~TRINITY_DN4347_c0_g1_i2.p1  ORF type:complete len:776 (+),score=247.52 TRINITY_DN4347_c0_g1_i2:101-2428(+)